MTRISACDFSRIYYKYFREKICRRWVVAGGAVVGWSQAVPSLGGRRRLEKREPRLSVAVISDFGRGSRDNDYPQVIVARNSQNRLRLRLRLSSMTALSSPSRFSCAGVVYHPPAPPYVAKSIQSPPKSAAAIGIPCKMLFADDSLSLLQRCD